MERLIHQALADLNPGSGRPCVCRSATVIEVGAKEPLPPEPVRC
jgi:hypothetical protein